MTQDNEQNQSSVPQSNGVQPPLRPTGFIQGEHGTLIPIYHPEALGQYMANSQHAQTPSLTQTQNVMQTPAWNSYAQNPIYPYGVAMPPVATSFPQQRSWMPNPTSSLGFPTPHHPVIHNAPVHYGLSASSSGALSNAPSFRHSNPSMHHHGHRNTPPLPKRFGRRDHHFSNSGFNPNYARSTHSMNSRFGRINNDVTES